MQQPDKQREAFEAWLKREYPCRTDDGYFQQYEDGKYVMWNMQLAFEAWQAAQQAQWQPIESNLPSCEESAIEYLVFDTLNNKVGHDYWMVPDDGGEPFWNHYGEYVSHWMPLPQGPNVVD